ncbi:TonB-dependent receptor [Saccharophagus degradans]|uniref:TonB-dependent receptor n=1 Tax=Saccharophagus degradans (strain 2-40 / ATCC 43961 / DSM 17024) TaxID=203122 RepID=Q21GD1_SACD2|nr:TonB-dependent receptor [Saccharophagus degradans]ABD82248.1 TonB-dependent receptor [Saccharophagus degradans 2-40]
MRNNNKEARQVNTTERTPSNGRFRKSLLVSAIAAVSCINVAHAQESEGQLEEVVVTGTRATIQSTIDIKRNSTTIVDGLSATDIGDMPALSIGEALENITGAASHRENGGATEISIRGLGPYLSATTFNGRGATNGSGDRSVNFSQFPSELVNKIAIYKTQDASLIEGGVAGLIALETVKPLEYGKQRIQVDAKLNFNPNQANIDDPMNGNLGFRGTVSYIDQFEIGDAALGVSLGYQKSDISQPESEMRSSSPSGSSLYACLYDPDISAGFYRTSSGDCNSGGTYNTTKDPETGKAVNDGSPYGFAPSSNGYRQNDTADERDAVFAAIQFQPTDKLDINLDVQQSKRVQAEQRHDLNFANMRRVTPGITDQAVVISSTGAVTSWAGETAIESNSETYSRTEEYLGYGLNVAYELTDDITISGDYSFSETTREEVQYLLRTQSNNGDVNGDSSSYRPLVAWDMDSGILQYAVLDFDVTDHAVFSDEYRVRIDNDVDRTNTATAFRADIDWRVSTDFITSVKGGIRYSELEYLDLGSARNEFEVDRNNVNPETKALDVAAISAVNTACAIDFPESNFLSSERSGDLVTQLASDGSVVGSSNSWATFDTVCAAQMIANYRGESLEYPELEDGTSQVTDVTEMTTAAYVMADFETSLANTPVRGNFGVRVVQTEVESVGYRTAFNVVTNDSGTLKLERTGDTEQVTAGGDYTELLPSVNVIADLTDNLMLRGAVYRGLSRPDPADLGYKRDFDENTEDDITDVNQLIDSVDGDGNPNMQPLTSWNFDAAIEWYANDDTMLGFGVYHKKFQGGFETIRTTESFLIDGVSTQAEFDLVSTNEETSNLTGFELNASHNFSYLPGYWSGLGVKGSFNHAISDFEFEDSNYGDITKTDEDGNIVEEYIGIVEPGNVPGFSENVFSGQIYYQIGELDTSLIYKYRSEYFQPYTSNGTRLRYVSDVGVWEARVSYKLTKNVKLSLEAINLFDEPKKQYFYSRDNLGELNSYGPRIFVGVKAKF